MSNILSYTELQFIFKRAKDGVLNRSELRGYVDDLNYTAANSSEDRACLLASLILLKFLPVEIKPDNRRRLQSVRYNGSSASTFRTEYYRYLEDEPSNLADHLLMMWWMIGNDPQDAPGLSSHFETPTPNNIDNSSSDCSPAAKHGSVGNDAPTHTGSAQHSTANNNDVDTGGGDTSSCSSCSS
ncbi:MAG: hypothetical protein PHC51_03665 [bacterium]|nr:hypothetical protein [bacterium]